MAGKTVALCYASEDEHLGPAVLGVRAALDAWEISWTDVSVLQADAARAAVGRAQALLRLCSPAIERSPAATAATNAFRDRMARDKRLTLVNLVLDTDYQHDPRDADRLYITTAGKSRARWLEELAIPLDVATLAQRVSRRALIGMGVGFGVAALAGGGAAALFEQQRQAEAASQAPITVRHASGQPNWTTQLGKPTNDLLDVPLVVASGATIYALISGQLSALNATTGAARHVSLGFAIDDYLGGAENPSGFFSGELGPALGVAGDDLFIRGAFRPKAPVNPSDLSVASIHTGKLRWRLELAEFRQPAVWGNSVIFHAFVENLSGTNGVSALRAHRLDDGRLLWSQDVRMGFGGAAAGTQQSMLAVDGRRVYAASFDHELRAFDFATGHLLWSFLTGGQTATPALGGGMVYVGSADYSVSALDAATGTLRWRYLTGGAVSCAPLVNGSAVYAASEDGYVYALDAATGALYWRGYAGKSFGQTPGDIIVAPPAIYRNVLVIAWRSSLFAYDLRTGQYLWTYPAVASPPSDISAQPVAINGLFVFGGPSKDVYAINP